MSPCRTLFNPSYCFWPVSQCIISNITPAVSENQQQTYTWNRSNDILGQWIVYYFSFHKILPFYKPELLLFRYLQFAISKQAFPWQGGKHYEKTALLPRLSLPTVLPTSLLLTGNPLHDKKEKTDCPNIQTFTCNFWCLTRQQLCTTQLPAHLLHPW